jgi:protein-arginine kinase activator protein McsA
MFFAGDALNKIPKKTKVKKKIERRGGQFVCGVCKKSFNHHGNCARHFEVHLGNTTCQICKAVLASKEMLSYHMVKHAGIIRCEKCNQTFSEHRNLQAHKLKAKCRRNGLK